MSSATPGRSTTHSVPREALLESAKLTFAQRRAREGLFGKQITREVAWDILLVLYTQQRGRCQTVTSVQQRVSAPGATVNRWLHYLESKGLLERMDHLTDRRVVNLRLTVEAEELLDCYFRPIAGNPLADG